MDTKSTARITASSVVFALIVTTGLDDRKLVKLLQDSGKGVTTLATGLSTAENTTQFNDLVGGKRLEAPARERRPVYILKDPGG